jgi:exopolyphosphatase/guanosine-5'-triphosphate,3'-diphosphate pyrophosphatase
VNTSRTAAAVDCGTNSTRLLIVDDACTVLARDMRITRLGQGVDRAHRLQPAAVARTLEVLKGYRSMMDREHVARARLVATSAVRDATNGEAFLMSAQDIVGVDAELLSGSEEGRLSFLGATHELTDDGGAIVVVDIGGGSTELVLKPAETVRSVSMDIGCVRLTERYLHSDPPTDEEVSDAVSAIGTEMSRAVRMVPELEHLSQGARLVGLAGTVSAMAMLELNLVAYDRARIHHAVLTRSAVDRWCMILGAESVASRAKRASLPVGRHDVVFGGALVLREVMRRLKFAECLVSESDILDGIVMTLLQIKADSGRYSDAIKTRTSSGLHDD